MAHEKNHDYHILHPSVYPLLGSVFGFVMLFGAVLWMHEITPYMFWIGFVGVLYTMFGWWSETVKENNAGDHTPVVQIGLRYGVILFIASEVMFFVAWFWAFFEYAIFHEVRLDPGLASWPPAGVETFDPWHIPLMNTLILLLSGTTVTWAHHALQHGDRRGAKLGLIATVILGACFSALQVVEYTQAGFAFSMADGGNLYGSTFFMATGFHGAHVLIGTIFLAVCLVRLLAGHFTPEKHSGLEAAAWYWHFVDLDWLFLFAFVYVTFQ